MIDSQDKFEISEKDKEILRSVRAIKYGTVLIVVQNSRIVQIETTHKRRFDDQEKG